MPHKILRLNNLQKNDLTHLVFEDGCFTRFFWKWGEPRGGTPAKLIDGKYLSITIVITAHSKQQLDAIYQELTDSELVIMAL